MVPVGRARLARRAFGEAGAAHAPEPTAAIGRLPARVKESA